MADELSIDSKALIFATLADVYLTSGMLDEAISILKDGLARNPGYTLAKIILGRAYYMKGETEEALKLLEAIYPEAKDSENENLYLGHCYKRLTDFDKARKHYEATLKINPDNKDAKKELSTLGSAVPEALIKTKKKKGAEYEKPLEIEAKPLVEIQSSDSSVPIKEVVLPEGDITIVHDAPEPDMVIQEPTLKINVPPPVHETIDKEEIEIVLPSKEEDLSEEKPGIEVPVSWVETKNEAEAIQKKEEVREIEAIKEAEIPQSGIEMPVSPVPAVEPEVKPVPPEKEAERPPEILAAELSVSEEVKKRIEALAASAQASEISKTVEEKLAEISKQAEPVAASEEKPEPIEEIQPPETKQEVEAIQKAEIPPSGVEAIQKAEIPPSGVEAIQKAEIPPSGGSEPPPLFAEEMKAPEPVKAPAEQTGTPFDRLNVPMEKLLSLKTVNASFISSRDGLLIKNYSEQREDIEEISALIAAIYNEAFESFKYLNEGSVEKIIIEKSRETICVITAGESLLCVITQPEAKPGLIFVYARKIIDEIREVLG
jgi:predicted regulator of Ras-like GTPase activity (Roadblock/LC7/MglB family)